MAYKEHLEVLVTYRLMYADDMYARYTGEESSYTQIGEDFDQPCRPDLGRMDAWYEKVCETFFKTYNDPEMETGVRSMSVGDRVVFEFGDSSVTYECMSAGWEKV